MVLIDNILDDKDMEVLLFVNKYKYVKVSDFKYLYNMKQFYRTRLKILLNNSYLRKIKWYVILGKNGKIYLESLGYKCPRTPYEKSFVERNKIISSFAAYYKNNPRVNYIPSVDLKDKDIFTITSRRFIRNNINR